MNEEIFPGQGGHNKLGFRYLMCVCYYEGIHMQMDQLLDWMKFETEEDFKKLQQRLAAVPARV